MGNNVILYSIPYWISLSYFNETNLLEYDASLFTFIPKPLNISFLVTLPFINVSISKKKRLI